MNVLLDVILQFVTIMLMQYIPAYVIIFLEENKHISYQWYGAAKVRISLEITAEIDMVVGREQAW